MADKGDDVEDPVEKMMKLTGCTQQHYKVQECFAEKRDWRVCQSEVQDFKACMADYSQRKKSKTT